MQRGKEGIARVPSLPVHPSLGLGMILRLASGVVNHTTHEKKNMSWICCCFAFSDARGIPLEAFVGTLKETFGVTVLISAVFYVLYSRLSILINEWRGRL